MDLEVERREGNKIGKLMVIIEYFVIKVKQMNTIPLDSRSNEVRTGIIHLCVSNTQDLILAENIADSLVILLNK